MQDIFITIDEIHTNKVIGTKKQIYQRIISKKLVTMPEVLQD